LRTGIAPLLTLLLAFGPSARAEAPADAGGANPAALAVLGRIAADAEKQDQTAVAGKDGWLFLVQELRHLSVGRFWGADAERASRASNRDWVDPLPAILDFRDQLKKAGVELLLVPVPPRAAVAPQELPEIEAPPTRLDAADAEFYALLRREGVEVLDLQEEFAKADPARPAICRTDTHWSGHGVVIAAKRIAERVRKLPWYAGVPKQRFVAEEGEVDFRGDLLRMIADVTLPPERVPVRFVRREGAAKAPIEPDPKSPVVLLSDSHGLVFSAGRDLHATSAGLSEQLALELGFPVDLVAVRGSGATAGRMHLARRKDNLAGKRFLVWAFAARYFSEPAQGWAKVPVVR
jgi:alginate O-acetyltransferase complex protein AlgJ